MNIIHSYDETALLRQLAEGSESAFEAIYNKYADSVRQFIVQYIKSPELADDLSQEVFMKLWEKRTQLSEIKSLKAYLFIMARNHSLNTLKRAANEDVLMAEMIRHYPMASNDAQDELLLKEYKKHLHCILDSLPPKTREVFYLCRECEKSYEEVATLLGISMNAVKKHMVRSMKVYKESFTKEIDIPLAILLIIFHS